MHHPARSLASQRRTLLAGLLGGCAVWASRPAWAGNSADSSDGRLIVVFLRGAYDGLSALVPYADRNYYALRPGIAIPAPDGSAQTAIALNDQFALHPSLAGLQTLWQQGVLAAIPAAGLDDPTRSHFDAQHQWEVGIPGHSGASAGWLNTLAGLSVPAGAASATDSAALVVGESNPLILTGPASVQRVPRGNAAIEQGALGNNRTHDAILQLYSGQDSLAQAFRAGADSRMQTAQTLSDGLPDPAMRAREMQAANNGAGSVPDLLLDARHLGTLMRQDRRLRIGFLSAGGWDTHANQGSVSGTLATNLGHLGQALLQLRQDFMQDNDVVMLCSEFGRTTAENGTRGTDHGHGNTLWLMGNRVQGGRTHGHWDGLAQNSLHEGRDLPVHHDFRAVFAQVLRTTQGRTAAQIDRLFPGFAWDASLDGLMKA